jgi:hypothetical protein
MTKPIAAHTCMCPGLTHVPVKPGRFAVRPRPRLDDGTPAGRQAALPSVLAHKLLQLHWLLLFPVKSDSVSSTSLHLTLSDSGSLGQQQKAKSTMPVLLKQARLEYCCCWRQSKSDQPSKLCFCRAISKHRHTVWRANSPDQAP